MSPTAISNESTLYLQSQAHKRGQSDYYRCARIPGTIVALSSSPCLENSLGMERLEGTRIEKAEPYDHSTRTYLSCSGIWPRRLADSGPSSSVRPRIRVRAVSLGVCTLHHLPKDIHT